VAGLIDSLARPGGNVTALLSFPELGGKRLELLKEAASKVARVAVLYDPAIRAHVLELKEVLQSRRARLRLTVRSWRIRAADDRTKVFAALKRRRPMDSTCSGPADDANEKRPQALRLKFQLPSMYNNREAVCGGSCPTVLTSRTATGASHTM